MLVSGAGRKWRSWRSRRSWRSWLKTVKRRNKHGPLAGTRVPWEPRRLRLTFDLQISRSLIGSCTRPGTSLFQSVWRHDVIHADGQSGGHFKDGGGGVSQPRPTDLRNVGHVRPAASDTLQWLRESIYTLHWSKHNQLTYKTLPLSIDHSLTRTFDGIVI